MLAEMIKFTMTSLPRAAKIAAGLPVLPDDIDDDGGGRGGGGGGGGSDGDGDEDGGEGDPPSAAARQRGSKKRMKTPPLDVEEAPTLKRSERKRAPAKEMYVPPEPKLSRAGRKRKAQEGGAAGECVAGAGPAGGAAAAANKGPQLAVRPAPRTSAPARRPCSASGCRHIILCRIHCCSVAGSGA